MNPAFFTRRLMLLLGASTLALGACSDRPADATASGFSGIDITGADYATGFSLTDHNGQARTLADFKGKAVVVFFGFTQCPDVCPTSLGELAQARQLLGADGERLQGLFISVDPERDTPEVMQAYMASFDPSFLALYSAPDALPELAKSYKVYYKKVEGKTPTSYTMDHSAGSYVYDTQGRIRLYHRYGSGAKALADDVKKLLDEAGN
jgi:protein SCO1/2